jgi:pyruvate formate lyase activating enzyme
MPRIIYDTNRCIGCGECVDVCPQHAIAVAPDGVLTNTRICDGCGACAAVCMAGARELTARTVTVDQLLEIIERDCPFYDESGGGVTFSGGEPLMQADFLFEILDACGQHDIHRAVDTSGYADMATIKAVAQRAELFLFDVKCIDPEKHERYTGNSNIKILKNLEYLDSMGTNIIIRIPLVPGMNDDEEELNRFSRFLSKLTSVQELHILPYHHYQSKKYQKLDMQYRGAHIAPPSREQMAQIMKRFEDMGFQVEIGG